VRNGREENERTPGKYARQNEKALLNRLEKYKRNHLLFLHDFRIPFSNNISEKDLRKGKNRQKMAGGFRKQSGSEMYCIILSVIEICKRKGMPLFDNIIKIFKGNTGYFLAGVPVAQFNRRLNCYDEEVNTLSPERGFGGGSRCLLTRW